MQIKDIYKLKDIEIIDITAVLSGKETKYKNIDGKPYLQLTIQDATGTIDFPIWNDYEINNSMLELGKLYKVTGVSGHWQNEIQIKNARCNVLDEEFDIINYMPSYQIPEELFKYFNDTVNSMKAPYKTIATVATGAFGFDKKRWKAFTTCVSATTHHGNKIGGLFLHTIGVMKAVESMCVRYVDDPFFTNAKNVINKDRLMLKAIIHDLKKDEEYEYKGTIKRKKVKLDHITKGIIYLANINYEAGNLLSEEDIEDISYSILSHHGQWGNFEPQSLEDTLLHLADMVDAKIVGAAEEAGRKKDE